jgi:hypothetical protein
MLIERIAYHDQVRHERLHPLGCFVDRRGSHDLESWLEKHQNVGGEPASRLVGVDDDRPGSRCLGTDCCSVTRRQPAIDRILDPSGPIGPCPIDRRVGCDGSADAALPQRETVSDMARASATANPLSNGINLLHFSPPEIHFSLP